MISVTVLLIIYGFVALLVLVSLLRAIPTEGAKSKDGTSVSTGILVALSIPTSAIWLVILIAVLIRFALFPGDFRKDA
jgi:uncharacterized membrane protein